MTELHFLPATEMASAIRRKEISPREVAEAHLHRIDQFNPRLNALIHVDHEGARRAADEAGRAVTQGAPLGPLHGVPVTIKSSIDVAGWPCESGTRLRAGRLATTNAPLVERLRKAGAILLGNTNTPELLMAYETGNVLYGRTHSPWDPDRTPGGSSGGEAAAIAAGLSACGVGSDCGGSIRIPAHYSGICGLKPTPGRVPSTGHYPASSGPFALMGVVGPMARTVGDLKTMFEVIAGPDSGDTSSAPVPLRWPAESEIRRARVGMFEEIGGTPVTEETRAAVRRAAECLQLEGLRIEPFKPLGPGGLERAQTLWWNFFGRAGGMVLGPMIRGREADLSPILKEFLSFAAAEPPLTAEDLVQTWIERDELRCLLLAQMEEVPVFICPVCSVPAFRHGEREWLADGRKVKYLQAMSYTQWFNVLGNPAAVVPVGQSPEGLPIGVQVVGRPYEEEWVLAIAGVIERHRGPWRKPPID